MNETNHPSSLATCTLIQDFLGVKDGGIYEAVVKQKQQLDAVVAENVALKESVSEVRRQAFCGRRNSHNCGPFQHSDLCESIIESTKVETPNVTAALAEVEAKAIEKAIEHLHCAISPTPDAITIVGVLNDFAKQLRGIRS